MSRLWWRYHDQHGADQKEAKKLENHDFLGWSRKTRSVGGMTFLDLLGGSCPSGSVIWIKVSGMVRPSTLIDGWPARISSKISKLEVGLMCTSKSGVGGRF